MAKWVARVVRLWTEGANGRGANSQAVSLNEGYRLKELQLAGQFAVTKRRERGGRRLGEQTTTMIV